MATSTYPIKERFTPDVPLLDPTNVDSEITPDQIKKKPPLSNEDKERLIQMGERRYKEGQVYRSRHDRDILTGIAFYEDQQWLEYSDSSGTLSPIAGTGNNDEERYYWITDNRISPSVDAVAALATQSYPDVYPGPLTDSQQDKQAAQIARSVLGHVNRNCGQRELLRDLVIASLISSTAWIENIWDPLAEADVALPQGWDGHGPMPDGPLVCKKAKIGDVAKSVILPIDMYIDPKAKRSIHDAAWIDKVAIRSLDYLKQTYGEVAEAVTPSVFDGNYATLESRISFIAGDATYGSSEQKNAALVHTMLEKPSSTYKPGRILVWAGNVLLRSEDWPWDIKDKYPYIPLYFKKKTGSVWGGNMVRPLIPVQMALNRTLSKQVGRSGGSKITLILPDRMELDTNDVNKRDYTIIPYAGGEGVVQTVMPPGANSQDDQLIERLINEIKDLAGVHGISADGSIPPNIAARTVELLQNQSQARYAPFIERIKDVCVEDAEWTLSHYRQFGAEFQRLLGLDDLSQPAQLAANQGGTNIMPPPDAPPMAGGAVPAGPPPPGMPPAPNMQQPPIHGAPAMTALVDLQALKNGQCRVVCTPGSGLSKLPSAELERVLEEYKAGVFGPPNSSIAAKIYNKRCQAIRSDDQTDLDIKGIEDYEAAQAAMQPNPAAIQAAADQAKQTLAESLAAIKVHSTEKEESARYQADIQVEDARAQSQIRLETVKNELAIKLLVAENDAAIRLIEAKANTPTTSVSIKGTLTPEAQASEEKKLGLETAEPDQIREDQYPEPVESTNDTAKGDT